MLAHSRMYRNRYYTFRGTSLAKEFLLKSERRKRYPKDWEQLARKCKERANWQCEVCHVTQGAERISHHTGAVYTVFLHAAHTTLHDTSNPNPQLQALCPTCHGRHDWQLRKIEEAGLLETRKHQMLLSFRK